MSIISVNNLTFAYEGSYDNIFVDVSFSVDTDWRTGLVGRNGRGKTTLLRLFNGELGHKGAISASVSFDYFPFEVADKDAIALDVIDFIAPGELWLKKRELSLLCFDEDALYRPFSTLSMGERTKLLLAALFLKENNFLLIDEPTNHLDIDGRAIMAQYLSKKSGFILVSHDRAFLDSSVDHILSINRSDIEVQKGNYSSFYENTQKKIAFETRENERLGREIASLKEAAERTRDWSDRVEAEKIGSGPRDRGAVGHKAARMMKRSKAIETRRENATREKEKLLKNVERNDALKLHPITYPKETLFNLREICVSYGGRTVFKPVSFSVSRGERVALTGGNGTGKSSLIKLILGMDMEYSGEFYRGSGIKISYVEQDASHLCGSVTDYAKGRGVDLTLFMTILRKLDFPRIQFEKDMESFSMGQRKKVLLAASLSESAHLYVFDEPLNYIDILSRIQIEELLTESDITLIFVDHDRRFIDNVASREIRLERS